MAPAGNKRAFITAVNCGADAVYVGLKRFSARGNADNFSQEELAYCVNYAKLFGVKVYAAVNTLVKNTETEDFFDEIERSGKIGVDAFIAQDMLLGKVLKEKFPDIVLHLSTQAGVCNVYGAKLAKEYGFSRVILARETKFEDIREIAKIIETEVFIQGALCSSFSGHCYMSSFIGGNSGNRGLCKQPCRKKYTYIADGKPIKGGYALSLSDLCIGGGISDYMKIGVFSFKIEGRMRRSEYVGAATAYYRALIDGEKNVGGLFSDLKRTFNRNDYTRGLAKGQEADFVSDRVQGHIGEKVGTIAAEIGCGEYLVKSAENGDAGDAYKILRNGAEVGAGIFVKNAKDGFILASQTKLYAGDAVNITTDVKVLQKIEKRVKKYRLKIFAILSQNATARFLILLCGAADFTASGGSSSRCKAERFFLSSEKIDAIFDEEGKTTVQAEALISAFGNSFADAERSALRDGRYFVYRGESLLQPAKSAALKLEDLSDCFSKVGEYPFVTELNACFDNVFIGKSELNQLRREIYATAFTYINQSKFAVQKTNNLQIDQYILSNINNKVIISKILRNTDKNMRDINRVIYLPNDYNDEKELISFLSKCAKLNLPAYLYLPAFASGKDLEILRRASVGFTGFYGEGYYALAFAKECGKELIAGCGFNVFNDIDVYELSVAGVQRENIVLSKELSEKEVDAFGNGFVVFSGGNVAVMDLIYCPFGKRCAACGVRGAKEIFLSDDCERAAKVVKYKLSDCRFIVYNPYDLKDKAFYGKNRLFDRTFVNGNAEKTGGNRQKGVY